MKTQIPTADFCHIPSCNKHSNSHHLEKDGLTLRHRVERARHRMTDGTRITENLKVVAALQISKPLQTHGHRLVSEEMDLVVILQELQAVRLVPSLGDHVEGNLTSNQVDEVEIGKLLLQHLHHLLSHVVLLVVGAKRVALLLRAIATHRADIDHSGTELNERSALHGNIQLAEVTETEVDELVQLLVRVHVRQELHDWFSEYSTVSWNFTPL